VWEWSGVAADEGDEAAAWFSKYLGQPVRLVRYAVKGLLIRHFLTTAANASPPAWNWAFCHGGAIATGVTLMRGAGHMHAASGAQHGAAVIPCDIA
jgi:hypothetical protein